MWALLSAACVALLASRGSCECLGDTCREHELAAARSGLLGAAEPKCAAGSRTFAFDPKWMVRPYAKPVLCLEQFTPPYGACLEPSRLGRLTCHRAVLVQWLTSPSPIATQLCVQVAAMSAWLHSVCSIDTSRSLPETLACVHLLRRPTTSASHCSHRCMAALALLLCVALCDPHQGHRPVPDPQSTQSRRCLYSRTRSEETALKVSIETCAFCRKRYSSGSAATNMCAHGSQVYLFLAWASPFMQLPIQCHRTQLVDDFALHVYSHDSPAPVLRQDATHCRHLVNSCSALFTSTSRARANYTSTTARISGATSHHKLSGKPPCGQWLAGRVLPNTRLAWRTHG